MSNNSTKSLLDQFGLSAKKKFGQNFLTDQNTLKKIVGLANLTKDTHVLEIGPGLGALTEHLLSKCGKLTAYEIDSDMVEVLKHRFQHDDKLEVIQEDILKVNLQYDHPVTVVANLPYYITTPILFHLLESNVKIDNIVIMVQKEVGVRLTATPNTKDYNALSVIVQYLTVPKYGFTVSKDVFHPKPNVDSAVISLVSRETSPVDVDSEEEFFTFVKTAFTQRRKTLTNNLSLSYGTKAEWIDLLEQNNIDSRIRAEALSLNEFAILYNAYKKTV